ncbi:MAG: TRAP transporter large permease subunit [Desulfuromonadales bacterium]|nr:TRAP transporter large permease subunit [Desulfuromonadales bacterium]NIS39210.1 TRAP transporter large permease subunit [Desulfuromonadales bacterium]
MDWGVTLSLAIVLILFLFSTGMPIFIAFLVVNVGGVALLFGTTGFGMFTNSFYNTVTQDSLMAIPLFILMGEVLFRSNAVEILIDSIDKMVGNVRGRHYVLVTALSTVFGALSGSAVAVAAMLGRSVMPIMQERGYDTRLSVGAILGGASLAPVIPPSLLVIMIGSMVDTSIAKLLFAGILPGVMLASMMVAYNYFRILRNPKLEPPRDALARKAAVAGSGVGAKAGAAEGAVALRDMPVAEFGVSGGSADGATLAVEAVEDLRPRSGAGEFFMAFARTLPFLVVIFSVMGLILMGVATPNESAGTGVVGALIAAAIFRKLSVKMFCQAVLGTAAVSTMILVIIACSMFFGQLLSFTGASGGLIQLASELGLSSGWTFLVLMLIPFFLCMFIDLFAVMLIAIPIYDPLLGVYNFDPVWFWTLFLINMTLGAMTPPFGYTIFSLKGASPDLPMDDVYAGAWPMVGLFVVGMTIMYFFPSIVTFLPSFVR